MVKAKNDEEIGKVAISSGNTSNELNKKKKTNNEIKECEINIGEILNECEEADLSDENMDPIEWTVRKVIPIPKHYYWELLASSSSQQQNQQENQKSQSQKKGFNNINADMLTLPSAHAVDDTMSSSSNYDNYVPMKVKLWHNIFFFIVMLYKFGNSYIATPVADVLGISSSSANRYIHHGISDEEYENSKRLQQERKERKQQQQKLNNGDTNTEFKNSTSDNNRTHPNINAVLMISEKKE